MCQTSTMLCLKALLASWLLSSSMTTLYTMLVCRKDWVPTRKATLSASPVTAVRALPCSSRPWMMLCSSLCPPSWMVSYKENKIMFFIEHPLVFIFKIREAIKKKEKK